MISDEVMPSFVRKRDLTAALPASQAHDRKTCQWICERSEDHCQCQIEREMHDRHLCSRVKPRAGEGGCQRAEREEQHSCTSQLRSSMDERQSLTNEAISTERRKPR